MLWRGAVRWAFPRFSTGRGRSDENAGWHSRASRAIFAENRTEQLTEQFLGH